MKETLYQEFLDGVSRSSSVTDLELDWNTGLKSTLVRSPSETLSNWFNQ